MRARRHVLGLSQEELAARSGLHRTYIGGIERGARNVALLNIVKLATALELRPDELVAAALQTGQHSDGNAPSSRSRT